MRKIFGIVEERVRLYPSNDTLGRRDCVEQLPVLSDMEKVAVRAPVIISTL